MNVEKARKRTKEALRFYRGARKKRIEQSCVDLMIEFLEAIEEELK